MAITRMTMEQIRTRHTPEEIAEFHRRMAATTEEDIRRHMIEDGEDPDAELPPFERPISAAAVRAKLGMGEAEMAHLLGVPVNMLQEWERYPVLINPTARALLCILLHEPEAALRALGGARAGRRQRRLSAAKAIETTSSSRNTANSPCAMPTAVVAMPAKPSSPAIVASTISTTIQPSIPPSRACQDAQAATGVPWAAAGRSGRTRSASAAAAASRHMVPEAVNAGT